MSRKKPQIGFGGFLGFLAKVMEKTKEKKIKNASKVGIPTPAYFKRKSQARRRRLARRGP